MSVAELERERGRTLAGLAGEYPFEPHWLDLGDGTALHYVDEGPRDAEPLVFVHGNPTWSFYWRHPILALARALALHRPRPPRLRALRQAARLRLPPREPRRQPRAPARGARPRRSRSSCTTGAARSAWARGRAASRALRALLVDPEHRRLPRRPRAVCASASAARRSSATLAVRGFNAFARARDASWRSSAASAHPRRRAAASSRPTTATRTRIATLRFVQDIPLARAHPSWRDAGGDRGRAAAPRAPAGVAFFWGERDWCFTPAFREEWQRRLPEAAVHARRGAPGTTCSRTRARTSSRGSRDFLARHPLP